MSVEKCSSNIFYALVVLSPGFHPEPNVRPNYLYILLVSL